MFFKGCQVFGSMMGKSVAFRLRKNGFFFDTKKQPNLKSKIGSKEIIKV